jgi:UDP-glucose 4-epimerase
MELKDSKILVIGGAGFIGSYVAAELLKHPVSEVIIYDNFARGKMSNIEKIPAANYFLMAAISGKLIF